MMMDKNFSKLSCVKLCQECSSKLELSLFENLAQQGWQLTHLKSVFKNLTEVLLSVEFNIMVGSVFKKHPHDVGTPLTITTYDSIKRNRLYILSATVCLLCIF